MKKIIFSVSVILIAALPLMCQNEKVCNLTFVLNSPSLPDDSSVYICGNLEQLGNWNPSAIKMHNTGNHVWKYKITAYTRFPIEYKYTLGSWEREGAGPDGGPLPNFNIKLSSDTIIENNILFWLNKSSRKTKGQVTGTVKYHTGLKGEGVPERDIIVWLPPDYGKIRNKRYPVMYMHDGQNIFDPATSSFGTDWQADEACDSLIRARAIEPLIVVGIYNTKERMAEYTPGIAGTAYMDFVINVVKPFIDKTYMTLPGRDNTFTGGSSAGGTISFMLAWNHPGVFSGAICMSPAFRIMNIDVVKDVSGYTGKKKDLFFYFDNGGKGLEERLQPGIDEMIKALESRGYVKGKDYFMVAAPEAEHNEAAWAKRLPRALRLLLIRQ